MFAPRENRPHKLKERHENENPWQKNIWENPWDNEKRKRENLNSPSDITEKRIGDGDNLGQTASGKVRYMVCDLTSPVHIGSTTNEKDAMFSEYGAGVWRNMSDPVLKKYFPNT